MGTRSLTTFNDEFKNEEIAVIYRQYDGYPQVHGKELFKFLNGMTVVNGLGINNPPKIANGMSCLAAQVVSHFKGNEAGGIYLYGSGTRDVGEQYIYTIYFNKKSLMIKMTNTYDKSESFDGTVKEFGEWIHKDEIKASKQTEQSVSSYIKNQLGKIKPANGQK